MTHALPQMERLIKVLEGRWTCQVIYEPNPRMPAGGTSLGWEECRVGPGRSSLLFDTRAHGESGDFEGAGFITWNEPNRSYSLQWLSNSSPNPGVFTGRWDGLDIVFDGYEYAADHRLASRHSITDIGDDAFLYTVDMGSAPEDLKRAATIHYTRD